MSTLLVVGAGGLGREVFATALLTNKWESIQFVDDNATGSINGIPVWGTVESLSSAATRFDVFIAVGNPAVKHSIYKMLSSNSYLNFPSVIHPSARIHWPEFVKVGIGSYIADGVIITTNVNIGRFVLVNLACTIGHDSVIGSFSSIMPSVNISGGATLGNEVYVGTGAKLIKATMLGNQCKVGAGAVVNRDIPAGETWAGVPAQVLRVKD